MAGNATIVGRKNTSAIAVLSQRIVVAAVELAEVAMEDTMVSMAMEEIIEAAVEAKVVPGSMLQNLCSEMTCGVT